MKPKDYSFYHYTKSFEVLCRILKEGFRPSYSLEHFSWVLDGNPLYLAFPCVCFCDIPLAASAMHRRDYGSYALAFDKGWDGTKQLTPLIYVNDEGPLAKRVSEKHGRAFTRCGPLDTRDGSMYFPPSKLDKDELREIWDFLPYLKATLGHTLQRLAEPRDGYRHGWLTKYLEDELEWRYIPKSHRDDLFAVQDYDEKTMAALNELSKAMRGSNLLFDVSDVAVTIVAADAERDKLVEDHSNLADKIRTWDELLQQAEEEG